MRIYLSSLHLLLQTKRDLKYIKNKPITLKMFQISLKFKVQEPNVPTIKHKQPDRQINKQTKQSTLIINPIHLSIIDQSFSLFMSYFIF